MKKTIYSCMSLLVALVLTVSVRAQSPKISKEDREKAKIETFSLKTGSLIRKEFTIIGSIKRIEVRKLVVTDLVTNSTLSGVRLETAISKEYGTTTETCFLDADEVDAFIKSAKYLLTPPASKTDIYVELHFSSRGGFQSGAFSDESGNWKYFIKLDQHDDDSYVFLDKYDFERLIELVSRSK